ncbi:MAG: class I SAM-dependent methyltransferase [Promethearchaeota archaeon]
MNHIPSGEDKVSIVANTVLNFLKKKLNKFNQFSFLDIGCGNGRDIDYLSSNFDNLTIRGIDISIKAIEDAKKLNSTNKKVLIECIDWKDLDDAQYDIIYMSGVYHFFKIEDRSAFISKIVNILNVGGYFFLSTLSSNDKQYFGKGQLVKNDPNSFQSEFFIHFSSEEELREDFKFLKIIDLFEFFHKNYSNDTEYHTMWMLIGRRIN